MKHPLQLIPTEMYRRFFLFMLASTLVIMVILNWVSAPLTTLAAPMGIVSYELAGTIDKAEQILVSWDTQTQLRAAFSLGFDYLFIPAYSLTIGLACIWVAGVIRARRWPFAMLGLPIAWGLLLAAFSDGVENIALTTMIFNSASSPWPQIAYGCAMVKFLLIFAGLIYAFYGFVVRLVIRP
jgi:hypothetical protein